MKETLKGIGIAIAISGFIIAASPLWRGPEVDQQGNPLTQTEPSGSDPYDFTFKLLTLLVSVGTLGIIVFQAFIIREQKSLMGGQLKAAQDAAEAAVIQAKMAEETISILERPRLYPICEPNFVAPLHNLTRFYDTMGTVALGSIPTVGFSLKNYGRTPAIVFNISAKVTGPSSDAPSEDGSYPLIDLPNDRIIHPEGISEPRTAALSAFKADITRADYDDLMGGRKFWWFVGTVGFDDIWGGKNTLHFCWKYDQGLRIFGPYPRERNHTEHQPKTQVDHHTPPAPPPQMLAAERAGEGFNRRDNLKI